MNEDLLRRWQRHVIASSHVKLASLATWLVKSLLASLRAIVLAVGEAGFAFGYAAP